MPTWGEILREIGTLQEDINAKLARGEQREPSAPSPFDVVRRKYLAMLSAYTERTTIIYYSGWMENRHPPDAIQIHLVDVGGLMEACSNVVKDRQLDLFLHSPGGHPDAAESLMGYLRTQFDDIRVIVPMAAMSAATMMALAADEIVMGAHSQLGPIDPQFSVQTPEGPRSAPGQAIKDQFEMAKQQCQDPANLPAWVPLLRSLAPGLLSMTEHARDQSEEIVFQALSKHMFKGLDNPERKAKEVAAWFADFSYFRSHGRRVSRDDAKAKGVVVNDLEDDQTLQDLVLSVHHATMHTLSATPTAKIVENHLGRAWIRHSGTLQVQVQEPGELGPQAPQPQPGRPPNRAERRRQGRGKK